MDNFRLTTKEEVLNYLKNQNLVLRREKEAAMVRSIFSQMGVIYSSFVEVSLISTIAKYPIESSFYFGAIILFSALSYNNIGKYHLCRKQIAENNKKMKWIENGTFQRNTLKQLEREVVAARPSDFSKTKVNPGKF